MTLAQIEKTRAFLHLVASVDGLRETQKLVEEIRSFYGDDFNSRLLIMTWNTQQSYSREHNERDRQALKGFLEGYLAKENKTDVVCRVLDDIIEGENVSDKADDRKAYVSKIYHAYYGKIEFDDTIKYVVNAPLDATRIYGIKATDELVKGLITKLRIFANELCATSGNELQSAKQEINFQSNIHVDTKTETNINISAIFNDARQKVEDAGLSDEQNKIVIEKLAELEELAKSKESKGKRWQKVKGFMKWLVEQGIQVAGILLPVLAQTIQ